VSPHGPVTRSYFCVALVALQVLPAQALGALTGSALFRFTSDYIYRGYSKSDGGPAAQVNADLVHSSGAFLGTWLSQVDLGGARFELNPYLGAKVQLNSAWRMETLIAGYLYDAPVFAEDADYAEWVLDLGYRDLASVRFSFAPNAYGLGHDVLDYRLGVRRPLSDTIEASAGIGYEAAQGVSGYDTIYWNLGLTWFAWRHLSLDLRYYDTREMNEGAHHEAGEESLSGVLVDNTLVFSVAFGF
jgi:uncharacterized protein (TIGR02001 family)